MRKELFDKQDRVVGLIVGKESVDLDYYPNLKVLGCNMTSVEHLPLEECEKRGIKVISLKGETEFLRDITSTAEHTIGLMIALLRNYKTAFHPPYKHRDFYKGHTLNGKTLGLIGGDGRVGRQMLNMVGVFGVHVRSFDPKYGFNLHSADWHLENLLKNSDIVSLHIPLEGNEGFFTKEMFQQMLPTSYLINTSRDAIVEKGALRWALENKIIAGAAVDFIDSQDLLEYNGDNLILTNHIGGTTFEDLKRTEEFIVNRVKEYIAGIKGNRAI